MDYLLLIYSNENEPERPDTMERFGAFTQSIIASGNYKGGNRLHDTPAATSVRVKDGKTLATDGPFAETREQLGGYYLITAKDLDEAIAIAARIPSAEYGTVEVRPCYG